MCFTPQSCEFHRTMLRNGEVLMLMIAWAAMTQEPGEAMPLIGPRPTKPSPSCRIRRNTVAEYQTATPRSASGRRRGRGAPSAPGGVETVAGVRRGYGEDGVQCARAVDNGISCSN